MAGPGTLRLTGGKDLPAGAGAQWRLRDGDLALTPGQAASVDLKPDGAIALELRLTGMVLGATYAADLVLSNAGGAVIHRWPISVRRAAGQIDAQALQTASAPAQQDGKAKGEALVPLAQKDGSDVFVRGPTLWDVVKLQNGVSTASSAMLSAGRIECGASTGFDRLPVLVRRGEPCQVRFGLFPTDGPGLYTVRFTVADLEGHTSLGQASIQVRRGFGLALGLAFAGTLLGWLLKAWSDRGRPRLLLLERVETAMAGWSAIHRAAEAMSLSQVTRPLGRRLAELRQRLQAGVGQEPDVAIAETRLAQLDRWLRLEEAARERAPSDAVAAAAKTARSALANADLTALREADSAPVDTALNAFHDAIVQPPPATETEKVPESGAAPSTYEAGDPEVGKARGWLRFFDALVGLVTMGLIASATYELVWVHNPAWGTVADMLSLFVGAVVAQAGTLTAADSFRTRVGLGRA